MPHVELSMPQRDFWNRAAFSLLLHAHKTLITGQGTRFVLADTEKLHQKIAAMSDRIRQLEDALAILQSTQTRDTHPLLQRELLKIKSSIELHAAVDGEDASLSLREEDTVEESQTIDAFGTLAIRDDGAATFYGRSAGSESLLIGEAASPAQTHSQSHTHTPESWSSDVDLPLAIRALASSFPVTSPPAAGKVDLDHLVRNYLPSWPEAYRLCELYMEQAPWFFGAVTRRQLTEEILPMWYDEAPRPPQAPPHSASDSRPPQTPHDLALLFIILCFGALTDISRPSAPDNPEAETYYHLTKASLALAPVLERPPSVATVQSLALMAIYEGLAGAENAIESTWAIMGLSTKLAQSVGLHRDCARWKLPPAEVQKRRALFWELFITDCWQVSAKYFPFWKARFGAECVAAVVQGTLTSRAPKYSIILELDRKVRDMELPMYAQGSPPEGAGLSQTMSHFMPTNYRELTLLYIHRCFFAHAINSHPQDPIKSQYAPSFLAGYRSACTILASLKQQFTLFPAQIARFWVLWTHAFSASVMLASVVTNGSQSKVAPAALVELRTACELFQQASVYGGRAVKFLPIMERLQMKAQQTFLDTNSGISPNIPNDVFKPSPNGEHKDELSIFSGRTHTVATKSNTPRVRTAPSRAPSDSPQALFTKDNPSFAGIHPSLVTELHALDGQIAAQIQDAYQVGGGVFAHPMDNSRERRHQIQMAERHQKEQMERQHRERHQLELERQRLYQEQHMQQQRQVEAHQKQVQEEQRFEHRRFREEHDQYQQQQLLEDQQRVQQTRHRAQQHLQRQQLEQRHMVLEQQRQPRSQQPHGRHSQMYAAAERESQILPEHPQPVPPQNVRYEEPYGHHVAAYSDPVPSAQDSQRSQTHVAANPPHHTTRLPRHSLTYSQSLSSLHRVCVQEQPQPQQRPQAPPPQHSMYPVSPEYRQQQFPSPEPSSSSSQFSDPETCGRPEQAYTQAHVHPHSTQEPQPATVPTQESYQYWEIPETVYAVNGQVTQVQQHYTPDAALRGIAADDRSLQETWQSYMYQVRFYLPCFLVPAKDLLSGCVPPPFV
ncbi:hypothetical protein DXG03_001180 [Asterophora parasitica]|uniref:Xylanolytic transcriptional activator regulatory domain-containing protein n=1 Tax=Asterophora parasitica TaxID=117018 RepID=A0A9P7G9V2_9AGAR|nr:hypothetical protein DXG03_001180 [Asterophora parasitica]